MSAIEKWIWKSGKNRNNSLKDDLVNIQQKYEKLNSDNIKSLADVIKLKSQFESIKNQNLENLRKIKAGSSIET